MEYRKGLAAGHTLFSYQDLIDLGINASHLIQYPGRYQIDSENHRIV
jgi:hypothetical protein